MFRNITKSFSEFKPDLIIYNAGTDVIAGDPLGWLNITANGIKLRDEIVFQNAKQREIPIVMLTRYELFITLQVINV